MELLGIGGILFWLGLLMFFAGSWLIWGRLARHGGLDRTQTLHIIFDEDSPMKHPANRLDRWIFRLGVFIACMGLMNLITAVTVGEEHEQGVCGQACRREGFWRGRFAPSSHDRIPETGAPQRACWCVGPTGSVEMAPRTLPLTGGF